MSKHFYPCIWFENKDAKQAGQFYIDTFQNGKITEEYDVGVIWKIFDFQFFGINAEAEDDTFLPNPSTSFTVILNSKQDVDRVWNKLLENQDANPKIKTLMALDTYDWSEYYGWINDKYGVSWQLTVPFKDEADTPSKQRIIPSLLYGGKSSGHSLLAMDFYKTIFPDFKLSVDVKNDDNTVKYARFSVYDGIDISIMDSGGQCHSFDFGYGVSFIVECDDQQQIDYYTDKLIADSGEQLPCGWVRDKYNFVWQIIPKNLTLWIYNEDGSVNKVYHEKLMKMKRIIVSELKH